MVFQLIFQSSWCLIRNQLFFKYYPNFWRYIRTILRFTEEEREVRKQEPPFVPARYIRTFDAFSEHENFIGKF